MNFIVKYIGILSGLLLLTTSLSAQVKLNLSQLTDGETYLVSLFSETTLPAPQNTTGLVQIVLKVPADVAFELGDIKSLVPNEVWIKSARIELPKVNPDIAFICFSMVNNATTNITYQAGKETPLFIFKNIATSGCTEGLALVKNDDPEVKRMSHYYNVTQNLTVLGTRGNAYKSVLNASVKCGKGTVELASRPAKEPEFVHVFPVPSSNTVNVQWKWEDFVPENLKLIIMDAAGSEVHRMDMKENWEERQVEIDVSAWPSGLYSLRFVADNFVSSSHKIIVSKL